MQGIAKSFRIPDQLWEALKKRISDLGMINLAQYLISLVCYDLAVGNPHHITGDFHHLPGPVRDRLFQKIAQAYLNGETIGGGWFENKIRAAAEEIGAELPPSKVAKKFQELLTDTTKPKVLPECDKAA